MNRLSCTFDSSSSAIIEMSNNAGKPSLARKFGEIASVKITRLEAQISKQEN